ncbi:MAG: nitroreductase [Burkholderiaceae bacterium]|nr:nitroreductase [Burkholderiaceae bacterium]
MQNDSSLMIDAAIVGRRSTRAFLNEVVPAELIGNILAVASRAPSGCNMQPWHVHVLTGAALQRMVSAVCHAYDHEPEQHTSEFQHSPTDYFEPYQSRRRKMGFAMYGLVGIPKGDKERMRLQQRRNFEFFGAPVGMFFTVHRDLPAASLVGYGAFLQNIMVSSEGHGLGSCFQTGWCDYHRVIASGLKFGAEEMLLGGMAIGYADNDAPINQLRTERVDVSEFALFHQA